MTLVIAAKTELPPWIAGFFFLAAAAAMAAQLVHRSSITIELDCAYFGPPLVEASGREWTLSDCRFVCHHVRLNEKEEWDDVKQPRPHSSPGRPMIEILDEEIKGDVLELGGFTERNTWAVWRIGAESFELTWKKKTEFKGGEPGATDNPDDAQRLREDH